MRTFSKKTMVVAASTAAVLTVGGIAYAYYATTVQGAGTGSATAAANPATQLTWTQTTAASGLVPNSTKNAVLTFSNPNSFAVNYLAHTVGVASVEGPPGCADNTVALLSGSASLPAGVLARAGQAGDTTTVTVPITMADSTTVNQNSCAGASFTIHYTVTP